MAHGDDAGLRLPPRLAPVQVVVVLVRDEARHPPGRLATRRRAAPPGYRVRLDDRVGTSFGRRSVDWELKGVPVRVEVGPRDLAAGEVTLVRRDSQEKRAVPVAGVAAEAVAALAAAQEALFAEAAARQAAGTERVATLDEAAAAGSRGFAVLPWEAVGPSGEDATGRRRAERALPPSRGRVAGDRRRRNRLAGGGGEGLLSARAGPGEGGRRGLYLQGPPSRAVAGVGRTCVGRVPTLLFAISDLQGPRRR